MLKITWNKVEKKDIIDRAVTKSVTINRTKLL